MEEKKNFSIYNLYRYGIRIGLIKKMRDLQLEISDILIPNKEKLLRVINDERQVEEIISKTKYMIDKDEEGHCAIELIEYGLSKSICDKLVDKKITIENLFEISNIDLQNEHHIINSSVRKIRISIEEYKKKNDINAYNMSEIILKILDDKEIACPLSLIELKKNLIDKFKLKSYEGIEKGIAELKEAKKIEFTAKGIQIREIRLREYLEKLSKNDCQLIKMRASGYTLAEVGEEFNLTRERIRQKEKRIFNRTPKVYEEKFLEIFEKYSFECDLFCKLFGQDELVYYYLSKKYTKGATDVKTLLDDEILDDNQQQILRENIGVMLIDNEYLDDSKEIFLEYNVKKYAQSSINCDDFLKIYNRVAQKQGRYDFIEKNVRAFEGKLERLDYVLMGTNHKFRYYPNEILTNDLKRKIFEVMQLSDGFYSTEYLMNSHPELVQEVDIRDEYELHNLLRRFFDFQGHVKFKRMPTMLINCESKDSFIEEKIQELAPISVNEFVEMMAIDYGHKRSTLTAYLTSTFREYIFSGEILIQSKHDIEKEKLFLIKEKMTDEFYLISDVEIFFNEAGLVDCKKYINSYNLSLVGYNIKGGYVLSKKHPNILGYLKERINCENLLVFRDKRVKNIQAINGNLTNLESEMEIVKFDDDRYITIKKMNELGITKEYLNRIKEEVIVSFQDFDFFNVSMVKDKVDLEKIEDCGLEDIFIESIISTIQGIRTLRVSDVKLFSMKRNSIKISSFIETEVYKLGSISIYELKIYLYEKYGIELSEARIKDYIKETDLTYMEIMDKVYLYKEDYYEEVYNDE